MKAPAAISQLDLGPYLLNSTAIIDFSIRMR